MPRPPDEYSIRVLRGGVKIVERPAVLVEIDSQRRYHLRAFFKPVTEITKGDLVVLRKNGRMMQGPGMWQYIIMDAFLLDGADVSVTWPVNFQ